MLKWTTHALDEDRELERLLEATPGFCNSGLLLVYEPAPAFDKLEVTLAWSFYGIVTRTLSSNLVLEADK